MCTVFVELYSEKTHKKIQPCRQHQNLTLSSAEGEPSEVSKASYFIASDSFGHPIQRHCTSNIPNRIMTSQFDSHSHHSTITSSKSQQRPSIHLRTTSQTMPNLMLEPTMKTMAAQSSCKIEESHQAYSSLRAGSDQQAPLTRGSNGRIHRESGRKPSGVNSQSQVSSNRNVKKRGTA